MAVHQLHTLVGLIPGGILAALGGAILAGGLALFLFLLIFALGQFDEIFRAIAGR